MVRRARRRLLVSCEHGGNRVPKEYAPLFAGAADVLATLRESRERAMKKALFALALTVAAQPAAVRAHHSFASEFDANQPVSLKGIVTMVEFINPHSMLHLDVKKADGTVTTWVFQTTNAGSLRSKGLARNGPGSLEQGATYTVKGFAARNGNPMGFLRVLVFPDKKEMTFWFGDPND